MPIKGLYFYKAAPIVIEGPDVFVFSKSYNYFSGCVYNTSAFQCTRFPNVLGRNKGMIYVPKANEQVLNRYIKNILKDLSETVPSLKEKVPTKLTMKQKEAMRRDKIEPETDLNGNVIVPRYDCVTSHTARRTGITNMYLNHKYTILQMMHVSGHQTHKTFMDYIKLSSEEIADEIASMSKKESDMW